MQVIPKTEGKTSAEKMLDILLAVGELGLESGGEARLVDLVEKTGLARPTVHRLLAQLKAVGFVSQDASGPYQLGPRVPLLAAQAMGGLDVRRLARPMMQAFCDSHGHTVHLGIRDGVDVVYIDKVEARSGTQVGSTLGQRRPVAVTALGKALLAFSDPGILAEVVAAGWPHRTRNTLRSEADLVLQLAQVRSIGCAFDEEESDLGLRCAAAAILNRDGVPVAAVSVTTLASQVDRDELGRLGSELAKSARSITAMLGGAA